MGANSRLNDVHIFVPSIFFEGAAVPLPPWFLRHYSLVLFQDIIVSRVLRNVMRLSIAFDLADLQHTFSQSRAFSLDRCKPLFKPPTVANLEHRVGVTALTTTLLTNFRCTIKTAKLAQL